MTPAVLLVRPENLDLVFSPALIAEIGRLSGCPATLVDPDRMNEHPEALAKAEVIFGTWGMPLMDEQFLDSVPMLEAVFYAAGSPKGFLTPDVFERGITISTAAAANAVPVAEYTVSSIVLSLKGVWQTMRETRVHRSWIKHENRAAGNYRSRVGLVSLGLIGRRVAQLLQTFDLEVFASDPHVSPAEMAALGVKAARLEEIFETCDVVSLHTPLLPATTGMIGGSLIARLKPNATLINTSRGGIIRQDELCRVLSNRPDLTAVLDVTDPEPPTPDSPIFDLPNVFLTPHISGSVGPECRRMAQAMIDEFQRRLRGKSLHHPITLEGLKLLA